MRLLWAWVAGVSVLAGSPATVALAPPALTFAYQVGSPFANPQAVVLSSAAAALFTATRPVQDNWLVLPSGIPAASGSLPGILELGFNPSGLGPGTYTSAVTFHTTQGNYDLPVTLLVTPAPVLLANPAFLEIGSTDIGPPRQVAVGMSNGAAAVLTTSPTAPWLTAVPGSNSVLVSTTVSKATAGLNSAAVKVTGSTALGIANNPLQIPVVYVVGTLNSGGPLTLTPASLAFQRAGRQTVAVSGPAFTAATATPWLNVTLAGQDLTVWANPAGMAAGTYQGTVALTANGVVELLPVSLNLAAAAPALPGPARRPRRGQP